MVYPSIKEGTGLFSETDKKDRTWILFATLCYKQLVILQPIDPKADLANVDSKEEDQDVNGVAPAASQVVDVLQAMVVRDHWILDNTALMSEVFSCPQCVDSNAVVDSSTRD